MQNVILFTVAGVGVAALDIEATPRPYIQTWASYPLTEEQRLIIRADEKSRERDARQEDQAWRRQQL